MSALPRSPAAPLSLPEVLPECEPDYEHLVTEDHKPVERIFVEKPYRLLTRPLYASWRAPGAEGKFLVLVNVGWFYKEKTPAVVPDVLLSGNHQAIAAWRREQSEARSRSRPGAINQASTTKQEGEPS